MVKYQPNGQISAKWSFVSQMVKYQQNVLLIKKYLIATVGMVANDSTKRHRCCKSEQCGQILAKWSNIGKMC
jgi:hypothetical protein